MSSIEYSPGAVRFLIENYRQVCERRDTTPSRLEALVQIADVDSALRFLSDPHYEVVLLHGLIGLTMEQTGIALEITKQAVSKRYALALEDMHFLMNGGMN